MDPARNMDKSTQFKTLGLYSYQKHDPQFYQTQKDRISLSGESDRKKPY